MEVVLHRKGTLMRSTSQWYNLKVGWKQHSPRTVVQLVLVREKKQEQLAVQDAVRAHERCTRPVQVQDVLREPGRQKREIFRNSVSQERHSVLWVETEVSQVRSTQDRGSEAFRSEATVIHPEHTHVYRHITGMIVIEIP